MFTGTSVPNKHCSIFTWSQSIVSESISLTATLLQCLSRLTLQVMIDH